MSRVLHLVPCGHPEHQGFTLFRSTSSQVEVNPTVLERQDRSYHDRETESEKQTLLFYGF